MAKNKKTVYSTDPEPERIVPKSVALPPNPAAPLPTLQQNHPVRVHKDRKKRGGKTVSVIKGVKSPIKGKQALLKLIKGKLGTGGTLSGDDIEIQGEHREKIVEILVGLGYKAKIAGG